MNGMGATRHTACTQWGVKREKERFHYFEGSSSNPISLIWKETLSLQDFQEHENITINSIHPYTVSRLPYSSSLPFRTEYFWWAKDTQHALTQSIISNFKRRKRKGGGGLIPPSPLTQSPLIIGRDLSMEIGKKRSGTTTSPLSSITLWNEKFMTVETRYHREIRKPSYPLTQKPSL